MKGWYAIIAFVLGFVLAQVWKFFAGLFSGQKKALRANFKEAVGYLMRSGGMPSGHTASMTGVVICLGLANGFNSGIFALAVATLFIIMYDALHVRYAVGEQGKVLNQMLKKMGGAELPVVEGHTMSQVVAGMILGVVIGGLTYFLCGRVLGW